MNRRRGAAVHLQELDGAAQLLERASFDLAHALPRDPEVSAGLRQGARDAVVESVADPEDLFLALAQRTQQPVQLLVLELELDQALHGQRRLPQVLERELLEGRQAGTLVERAQAGDERRKPLGPRRR